MICSICNTQYYSQSMDGPEEPCVCGHGVHKFDSPWRYAGWRGVLAKIKYTYMRQVYEYMLTHTVNKLGNWLYRSWDYK